MRKEIAFLGSMRVYSAETELSDEYFARWLNGNLRARDRGYLTLIKEQRCKLGLELASRLAEAVAQDKLLSTKGVAKKGKEAILADEKLRALFLEPCEGNEHLELEKEKMVMYRKLVEKCAHARFSEEFRFYREENTKRSSGKDDNVGFRTKLKVTAKK